MQETTHQLCTIKKVDNEKQIVYGEVYAPNVIDTDGEMMTAEDIEELAHKFMTLSTINKSIDTMHDNKPNGCYPVESFIARKGDLEFTEKSWVLATKIVDKAIWEKIKRGELNGYSMQSLVKRRDFDAEIEYFRDNVGTTEPSKIDGHTHKFFVQLGDDGKVKNGFTSFEGGHNHIIRRGTATEMNQGHSHRYRV